MAGLIGCLRGADVEEARAVLKLDDVVDVGRDADVLIQLRGCLVGRDAGFWGRGRRRKSREEKVDGEGEG